MRTTAVLAISVVLCVSGAAGARTHHARARRPAKTVEAPVSFDVNAVNNPATQDEIKQGDAGNAVLRAEILLDRQHFSPGEIDGRFGDNMRQTVLAFQKARGLQADGSVDQATWGVLNQDQKSPLTQYTITDADEAGPFVQIPANHDEQAKLDFAGYESPLEELAEHFHSSPKLLQTLNPDADFTKAGATITVPDIGRTPIYASQASRVVV